ncbi:imm11 family protein [Leptospira kirschneri]|uniref:imm11 family protein n=1 Tax=Leptospira kirschneri TaxID=29507 RepID=UPI00398A7D9D
MFSKFITIIYNSHTGSKTSNYKMVNMIDKLDCIDIQHSEYDRQSERKETAFSLRERSALVFPHRSLSRYVEIKLNHNFCFLNEFLCKKKIIIFYLRNGN